MQHLIKTKVRPTLINCYKTKYVKNNIFFLTKVVGSAFVFSWPGIVSVSFIRSWRFFFSLFSFVPERWLSLFPANCCGIIFKFTTLSLFIRPFSLGPVDDWEVSAHQPKELYY